MTMIEPTEIKCPICNTSFEIYLLMSTNSGGSPDLDLRPPEMQRSTMNTWVHECPGCGYASVDFELKPSVTRDFIESESYQGCDGFDFKNPLSKRFYREHLIESGTLEKFYMLLYCAWTCDDVNDVKNARLIRTRCIKTIKDLDLDENLEVKRADILRRSGNFAQVIEEYENKRYGEEILNQIKDFHIKKAKLEDDGCYTVADALEK